MGVKENKSFLYALDQQRNKNKIFFGGGPVWELKVIKNYI